MSRVARVLADRRLQPAARARTRLPGPGPARPRTQRRGRLGHALRPRNLKGSSASDATAHAHLGDGQDWRCGLRLALPSKRFHEISRVASMAAARLQGAQCWFCLPWARAHVACVGGRVGLQGYFQFGGSTVVCVWPKAPPRPPTPPSRFQRGGGGGQRAVFFLGPPPSTKRPVRPSQSFDTRRLRRALDKRAGRQQGSGRAALKLVRRWPERGSGIINAAQRKTALLLLNGVN